MGDLPSSRYDAFISYSRKDADFAARLRDRLEAAGKDVWMDTDDIPKGEDWRQQIHRGIGLADNFVFILSPDSVRSKECDKEVEHALEQGKRLLPVVGNEVNYSEAHPELGKVNFIIPGERGFDGVAEDLISAIETDLEHVQNHTMLLAKALDWDQNERRGAFLIRGQQLVSGERWLAQSPTHGDPQPTALHTEFIHSSRVAATRLTRIVFSSVTVFLLVGLGLTLVSLAQRTKRLDALRAENFSLHAEEFASQDTTLAFDLARRAHAASPGNSAAEALIRRLYYASKTRPFFQVLTPQSSDHAAALAAFGADPFTRYATPLPDPKPGLFATRATWDGRYVLGWSALAGEDGQKNHLELQDNSGRVVLTRDGEFDESLPDNPDPVVVPSPDGRWLFVAAGAWRAHLYGEGIAAVSVGESFGKSGIEIVGSDGYSDLVAIDMAQGEEQWSCIDAPSLAFGRIPPDHRITAAAFSPDGRRLIVAYYDLFRRVLLAFFDVSAAGEPILDVEATACFQHTGEGAPIAHAGRGAIQALRFSPDGTRFVAAGRDGGAGVFERGDEWGISQRQYRLVAGLSATLDNYVEVAWQDADSVLTASADGTLKRWNLEGRTHAAPPSQIDAAKTSCVEAPGAALSITETSGETWALLDAQKNRLADLRSLPIMSHCRNYILDRSDLRRGKLLAGDGQPLATLHGPRGWHGGMFASAVHFSDDEAYLLSDDGELAWPLSAQAITGFIKEHGLPAPAHRFSAAELLRVGVRD